jgi:hypothetical protein
MIGGSEPARPLDLRLLLRLKDRAVRARNRNCVLPQDCAGHNENERNRTPTAELDFGSEANHAISNYQTVFAAVPTVKQNQPPLPELRLLLAGDAHDDRCVINYQAKEPVEGVASVMVRDIARILTPDHIPFVYEK